MSDSTDAVAQRAEREVMACIGCHDCMLACPLPEALTVTADPGLAADLNRALVQAGVAVSELTTEQTSLEDVFFALTEKEAA